MNTNINISEIRQSLLNMQLGDVTVKKFGKEGDYLVKIEKKDIGKISVEDRDKKTVSEIQMIFQNPFDTLNPSHSVGGQILRTLEKVGVGSFVGFCSSFVRTPIERVKTVMQIRNQDKTKAPYKNSLICAYRLFRTEGIHKGLYEGLDTTIYREVPQYMFYFIFRSLRRHIIYN